MYRNSREAIQELTYQISKANLNLMRMGDIEKQAIQPKNGDKEKLIHEKLKQLYVSIEHLKTFNNEAKELFDSVKDWETLEAEKINKPSLV